MKTILHHFFENGGIFVIYRDGTSMFQKTPETMTGFEHLQQIRKS